MSQPAPGTDGGREDAPAIGAPEVEDVEDEDVEDDDDRDVIRIGGEVYYRSDPWWSMAQDEDVLEAIRRHGSVPGRRVGHYR